MGICDNCNEEMQGKCETCQKEFCFECDVGNGEHIKIECDFEYMETTQIWFCCDSCFTDYCRAIREDFRVRKCLE